MFTNFLALLSKKLKIDFIVSCVFVLENVKKIAHICAFRKNLIFVNLSKNATEITEIKKVLAQFLFQLQKKWRAAQRKSDRFLAGNNDWLNTQLEFPCYSSPKNGGRPKVEFGKGSERSKRRKTKKLRSEVTSVELAYATQMSFRSEGQVDVANVIKDVTSLSPNRATRYRKAFRASTENSNQLTPDKALSVIIEGKLTRHQYNVMRSAACEANSKLFPNYETVRAAKKLCYPEGIMITEQLAEVKLQTLLDHTARRIIQLQSEVIKSLKPEQLLNLCLISKWGCDGSSGQSQYKQSFEDTTVSDANIFLTSLVPLQIICDAPDHDPQNKLILWQNPRTSSPRFCRPIRLQFVHETVDVTVNEMKHVEQQINDLLPCIITSENNEIAVKYKLSFTMIDGKVCNAVSSTKSTQRCYLCGATSKHFNNIDQIVKRKVDESLLRFGLSSLHAWIRFFECLLHLSYKLNIGKWQVRQKEDKIKLEANKRRIQEQFKLQLSLIVDRPKPGYGSTNDGNTARTFFRNAEVSSKITGVNVDIIKRFYVILQTISSGFEINSNKFKEFTLETARMYVAKYPWYYMPTTVHKILIHSPQVISSAILPIGQLSEEAQEARNKDIKKYREGFSRKFSRRQTMEDVFNLLLASSDPYISSIRQLPTKNCKSFSRDVLNLLTTATPGSASAVFASSCHSSNSTLDTTESMQIDSDSSSD